MARDVPSLQVASSRVRSGQLRLGLVLWDIDAIGGTDLWRNHSQGCTAPCDDIERNSMSRGIGLAYGLSCAGHLCRHPRLGGSRPHCIPPARKNVWRCQIRDQRDRCILTLSTPARRSSRKLLDRPLKSQMYELN